MPDINKILKNIRNILAGNLSTDTADNIVEILEKNKEEILEE